EGGLGKSFKIDVRFAKEGEAVCEVLQVRVLVARGTFSWTRGKSRQYSRGPKLRVVAVFSSLGVGSTVHPLILCDKVVRRDIVEVVEIREADKALDINVLTAYFIVWYCFNDSALSPFGRVS
ncbi:hypothetical protein Tco_0899875, partial [Tanacetum coccineum]